RLELRDQILTSLIELCDLLVEVFGVSLQGSVFDLGLPQVRRGALEQRLLLFRSDIPLVMSRFPIGNRARASEPTEPCPQKQCNEHENDSKRFHTILRTNGTKRELIWSFRRSQAADRNYPCLTP